MSDREAAEKIIDQIIEHALAWGSADPDRPDPVPPHWQKVLSLLRAAPRLRDAADALLANLVDAEEYGPADGEACEEDNLPCDADGEYWYHDTWELAQALVEADGERVQA